MHPLDFYFESETFIWTALKLEVVIVTFTNFTVVELQTSCFDMFLYLFFVYILTIF